MTAALTLSPLPRRSGPSEHIGRARPAISIRPVPALEPPTDDELARAGILPPPPQAPPLPLPPTRREVGFAAGPAARSAGAVLRPAAKGQGTAAAAPVAEGRAGHPTAPPPAATAAHRFLAACVEVLGGYRPPAHLRGLCTPEALSGIVAQLTGRHSALLAGRTPLHPRPASGAPPRAARAAQTAPGSRVAVRRVVVSEPLPGVAEVAVVLSRKDRAWAIAIRLELRGERWCCTYLRVL
jgi:hypothetical protein